jgi:fucose 4-O-acetylase-like acetyltransferase
VLLLGAGFAYWRSLAQLKVLRFAGQNSLVLYVVHLQIIYSILLNLSWITTLPLATAACISFPLTLAASLAVAWLLDRYCKPRKS